jgi:hypothetical protein
MRPGPLTAPLLCRYSSSVLPLLLWACASHGEPRPRPADAGPVPIARAFPARIGAWRGGAIETGDGFFRRDYVRGAVHVNVTLALRAMDAEQYGFWTEQAAAYPPVDLPPEEGIGFYSCDAEDPASACDLHVQLRRGIHVEVMGGGKATRADLTEVLRGLPLTRMTTQARSGGSPPDRARPPRTSRRPGRGGG